MITSYPEINVPTNIINHADTIKHENYKTNSPAKFQKHNQDTEDGLLINKQIADLANVNVEQVDWVYFSVCQGAEPHVDQLDPNIFRDDTFIIPIIVPTGRMVLECNKHRVDAKLNKVYHFDHTKIHSLELENKVDGCVVIMAAITK